ncbi:hypothetical protein GNF10_32065 [Nostoc sp. UCD121]|nr:hypothetical protein [Nostoc sp. UCD121]MBC1280453.1 hypothetical protein [Nostoc sp. UCD121]
MQEAGCAYAPQITFYVNSAKCRQSISQSKRDCRGSIKLLRSQLHSTDNFDLRLLTWPMIQQSMPFLPHS